MYARVTTTAVGPDESDSAAEIFDSIVPVMRGVDGYRGLVVLNDVEGNQLLVVSLWETADAMAASEAMAARIKAAETANRSYEIEATTHYRVDAFDLAREPAA